MSSGAGSTMTLNGSDNPADQKTNVVIGNLKRDVDNEALKTLLCQLGRVTNFRIEQPPGIDPASPATGIVEYASAEDAARVVAHVHGKLILGRPVTAWVPVAGSSGPPLPQAGPSPTVTPSATSAPGTAARAAYPGEIDRRNPDPIHEKNGTGDRYPPPAGQASDHEDPRWERPPARQHAPRVPARRPPPTGTYGEDYPRHPRQRQQQQQQQQQHQQPWHPRHPPPQAAGAPRFSGEGDPSRYAERQRWQGEAAHGQEDDESALWERPERNHSGHYAASHPHREPPMRREQHPSSAYHRPPHAGSHSSGWYDQDTDSRGAAAYGEGSGQLRGPPGGRAVMPPRDDVYGDDGMVAGKRRRPPPPGSAARGGMLPPERAAAWTNDSEYTVPPPPISIKGEDFEKEVVKAAALLVAEREMRAREDARRLGRPDDGGAPSPGGKRKEGHKESKKGRSSSSSGGGSKKARGASRSSGEETDKRKTRESSGRGEHEDDGKGEHSSSSSGWPKKKKSRRDSSPDSKNRNNNGRAEGGGRGDDKHRHSSSNGKKPREESRGRQQQQQQQQQQAEDRDSRHREDSRDSKYGDQDARHLISGRRGQDAARDSSKSRPWGPPSGGVGSPREGGNGKPWDTRSTADTGFFVHVGGLSFSTTFTTLAKRFAAFGDVNGFKVIFNKVSCSAAEKKSSYAAAARRGSKEEASKAAVVTAGAGFAFISFDDERGMEKAVEGMDGQTLDGQVLRVTRGGRCSGKTAPGVKAFRTQMGPNSAPQPPPRRWPEPRGNHEYGQQVHRPERGGDRRQAHNSSVSSATAGSSKRETPGFRRGRDGGAGGSSARNGDGEHNRGESPDPLGALRSPRPSASSSRKETTPAEAIGRFKTGYGGKTTGGRDGGGDGSNNSVRRVVKQTSEDSRSFITSGGGGGGGPSVWRAEKRPAARPPNR